LFLDKFLCVQTAIEEIDQMSFVILMNITSAQVPDIDNVQSSNRNDCFVVLMNVTTAQLS